MNLVQSPLCYSTCQTENQIADRILQDCPTFSNMRTEIWPDDIALLQQLHGTTKDLKRTVGLIQNYLDYLFKQANMKKKITAFLLFTHSHLLQ